MKTAHWIIIALAACLIIAIADGLRIRDKGSVVYGQYQEAANIAAADAKLKDTLIGKQNMIITEKDKIIAEKNETIGHITSVIGQKDVNLDKLTTQLATLTDKDAIIVNLKEQIAAWSSKFILAQNIIVEKDKIIGALTAKFDAQVVISDAWKAKYEGEFHLRTLAEKGWGLANRKLKTSRILGNLKTGLVVAAGVYFGYANLIKGK